MSCSDKSVHYQYFSPLLSLLHVWNCGILFGDTMYCVSLPHNTTSKGCLSYLFSLWHKWLPWSLQCELIRPLCFATDFHLNLFTVDTLGGNKVLLSVEWARRMVCLQGWWYLYVELLQSILVLRELLLAIPVVTNRFQVHNLKCFRDQGANLFHTVRWTILVPLVSCLEFGAKRITFRQHQLLHL